MSRGPGRIERTILDICGDLLSLKARWEGEGKSQSESYSGGTRWLSESLGYVRVVIDGGRRVEGLTEDVIDLREVSHRFRLKMKKRHMEGSIQASFSRALRSLRRKGFFTDSHKRFTGLNVDKCYEHVFITLRLGTKDEGRGS